METDKKYTDEEIINILQYIKYEVDFIPEDEEYYIQIWGHEWYSDIRNAFKYRNANFDRMCTDALNRWS